MAVKISCSCPDAIAVSAAETYHTAKGEEFGMSELVQVGFAVLAKADDKLLQAAKEEVVKQGGGADVILPGLKTKQPSEAK